MKAFFCENGDAKKPCLRRILGTIGFLSCIIALFTPGIDSSSFQHLAYVSAALIGITTFDKFSKGEPKC